MIQIFNKEDLQNIAQDIEVENFELIEKELNFGSGRYSRYKLIFKYENKFYRTGYTISKTERIKHGPYENEENEIECVEVFPIEEKIITYKPI